MKILAKFFSCSPDVFARLPKATITNWTWLVITPGYTLSVDEHRFLIGEIQSF